MYKLLASGASLRRDTPQRQYSPCASEYLPRAAKVCDFTVKHVLGWMFQTFYAPRRISYYVRVPV